MKEVDFTGRPTIKASKLLGCENEDVYTLYKYNEVVGYVVFDQIEKDGYEFIGWFFMPPDGNQFVMDAGISVEDFKQWEDIELRCQMLMRLYSHLEPTECRVINLYMRLNIRNANKPIPNFKIVKD